MKKVDPGWGLIPRKYRHVPHTYPHRSQENDINAHLHFLNVSTFELVVPFCRHQYYRQQVHCTYQFDRKLLSEDRNKLTRHLIYPLVYEHHIQYISYMSVPSMRHNCCTYMV